MSVTNTLLGIVLALAVAVSQASSAAAAPTLDPLVGTITDIQLQGDGTSLTETIVVSYTDIADGYYHTVSLSLTQAVALGLITLDPDGTWSAWTILGAVDASIDLTGYTFEAVDSCAGVEQPVAGALCSFFFPRLGVDYDMIIGWHEDGFGLGVVAQALFMAQQLGGDAALADEILSAKKTGDYSAFGSEHADITNWGQFKKAVMSGEDTSLTNLGAIISGRAQSALNRTPTEEAALERQTNSSLTNNGESRGQRKNGEGGQGGEHGKGKDK